MDDLTGWSDFTVPGLDDGVGGVKAEVVAEAGPAAGVKGKYSHGSLLP